jgi:hypothetical protein
MKIKVNRSGTLGGYQVTGWQYLEDASWHVKVWLAARPGDWMGYTVTDGEFELKTGAEAHKGKYDSAKIGEQTPAIAASK